MGISGLVLAAMGLFLFTIFLEPLAVVLGVLAWREGNKSLERGEKQMGERERRLGRSSIIAGSAVLVFFILLVLFVGPDVQADTLSTL